MTPERLIRATQAQAAIDSAQSALDDLNRAIDLVAGIEHTTITLESTQAYLRKSSKRQDYERVKVTVRRDGLLVELRALRDHWKRELEQRRCIFASI